MNSKRMHIFIILWGLILAVSTDTFADGPRGSSSIEKDTVDPFPRSVKISGNLHSTYVLRSFDGEEDSDIYEFFSLRMKDMVNNRIDGFFSMYWHKDLDGKTHVPSGQSDPFLDLDTSGDVDFRCYNGYLDFRSLGFAKSRLRIGRQFLEQVDYAHFDGASYSFSPIDALDIALFGGRPIAYYSSSGSDALYGSHIQYRLTRQTKASLCYYRYDADNFRDDLGVMDVWHRFAPNLQTHIGFSLLDGEPYMLRLDWCCRLDPMDMDAMVQVLRLFDTVGDHTINFNPYFPLLNGYEPFTYGSFSISKGIYEFLSLTAGFDFSETEYVEDPIAASSNLDYLRFTAGFELDFTEQLTLRVDGEFWDVDSGNRFTGLTGEVEYCPTTQLELSAAVDYGESIQEFRDEFMFYLGEQDTFRITPEVLTYYARAKWRPANNLYVSANLEIEDNELDGDEWYSFRLELGVHF